MNYHDDIDEVIQQCEAHFLYEGCPTRVVEIYPRKRDVVIYKIDPPPKIKEITFSWKTEGF